MGLTFSCFSGVSNWDSQGSLGAVSPCHPPRGPKQADTSWEHPNRSLQSLVQPGKEPRAVTRDFSEDACNPVQWSLLLPSFAYGWLCTGTPASSCLLHPLSTACQWLRQGAVAKSVVVTGCQDNQPLYVVGLWLPESQLSCCSLGATRSVRLILPNFLLISGLSYSYEVFQRHKSSSEGSCWG